MASTEVVDGENPVVAGDQLPENGLVASAGFGVGELDGFLPFHIGTRPDRMSVTAALLFMKDDGARLAAESKFVFNLLDRRQKILRPARWPPAAG